MPTYYIIHNIRYLHYIIVANELGLVVFYIILYAHEHVAIITII